MPVYEIIEVNRIYCFDTEQTKRYEVIYRQDWIKWKLDFTSDKDLTDEEILKRIENA